MIKLHPDQEKLINDTRSLMRGHKSVLVQAATGFGKTYVTAAMVKSAMQKGSRSMMVVPRRELLRQTSETFARFDIPHSFVAAGYSTDPFKLVTVATAGTLVRRLEKVIKPDVVFIDETHHGAGQLETIIRHYQNKGSWVLGLSATPSRLDGRGLGEWYSAMAEGPPIADLISSGRLSDYRIFAPDTPDLTGIGKAAGDYAKGELSAFMERDRVLIGNAVKHYNQHAMGKLNLCFCVSIAHAEIVADMFKQAGIPAACIHGKMDDAARSAIIKDFARRKILVLTSVDLLTFGFDLSSAAKMDVTVECMSDLRPTKSLSLQLQKWGRVLRKKDEPALIFDHAGNSAEHGLPDEKRDWTLEGRRKRGGGGERSEPVSQCPECHFVHRPSPVCPNCEYEYPVKSRDIDEVEGDLKEVDKSAIIQQRKHEQSRAETLEDLIEIAKRRGHNPRWAHHVWAARQKKRATG